ncbi:MAG TPA: ester cyclase [Blastocatellia bacterium]|nr:ester cyclase [Blastocatellia bacterium]
MTWISRLRMLFALTTASRTKEIHMREEDLELLITLDNPEDGQEEDTFNHLQADSTVAFWPNQQFPASGRSGHRAEGISENDPYTVAFGQGDWTCTLMRFTGTTNDALNGPRGNMMGLTSKNFGIECCRVTQWKNGKIVKEKVFYELVGLEEQIRDVGKGSVT